MLTFSTSLPVGTYARTFNRMLPAAVISAASTRSSSSRTARAGTSPEKRLTSVAKLALAPSNGNSDGLPLASRNCESRRQPAITLAARLYCAMAAASSAVSKPCMRRTSLRVSPVMIDTREIDCLRPGIPNSCTATSTYTRFAKSLNAPYGIP
jgi:hypothetical protein